MRLSASVYLYNLYYCSQFWIIHGQLEHLTAHSQLRLYFPLQLFLVAIISMLCTVAPVHQAPKVLGESFSHGELWPLMAHIYREKRGSILRLVLASGRGDAVCSHRELGGIWQGCETEKASAVPHLLESDDPAYIQGLTWDTAILRKIWRCVCLFSHTCPPNACSETEFLSFVGDRCPQPPSTGDAEASRVCFRSHTCSRDSIKPRCSEMEALILLTVGIKHL